jgi:hypothetical protein
MTKPTPDQYIVQSAHLYVSTKRALIAAPAADKPAMKSAHWQSEKKLIESVDCANRQHGALQITEGEK